MGEVCIYSSKPKILSFNDEKIMIGTSNLFRVSLLLNTKLAGSYKVFAYLLLNNKPWLKLGLDIIFKI